MHKYNIQQNSYANNANRLSQTVKQPQVIQQQALEPLKRSGQQKQVLQPAVTTQHQKSAQDIIRILKHDVERLKDENEELREDLQQITQKYLKQKHQAQELTEKVESFNRHQSGQKKNIENVVDRLLQEKGKENILRIEELKGIIEKQQKQKTCLSKCIIDLQDHLKITRQELQHTRKQLYSQQFQSNLNDQGKEQRVQNLKLTSGNNNNLLATISSGNSSGNSKKNRNNKVQNYDAENELDGDSTGKQRQKNDRRELYLESSKPSQSKLVFKQGRNALMVAKSVAVMPNSQNQYNWLFNEEDETPRIVLPLDSSKRHMVDSTQKMIGNQEGSHRTYRSSHSKTAVTSQNFPLTNNQQQTKNGISREMDFNENFTESIQSEREVTDKFLLNRQKANNRLFQGQDAPQRDSLVHKSIQNVKNMIRKAAEGLRTSNIEVFGEAATSAKNNLRQSKILTEVNHEMVEIELDAIDQSKLRGTSQNQFTGKRSVYERQFRDQTVFSDLNDQNPLDEDSN